jgi:hypothetical protein
MINYDNYPYRIALGHSHQGMLVGLGLKPYVKYFAEVA